MFNFRAEFRAVSIHTVTLRAENAHHVIHMAVSRTKNTEQLTKLVHKTSTTVQNMYSSPPKSRGYDEENDSKIQHEFKSEKMMQEKFDFENAIARSAQCAHTGREERGWGTGCHRPQ
jgi:hypothetical protein